MTATVKCRAKNPATCRYHGSHTSSRNPVNSFLETKTKTNNQKKTEWVKNVYTEHVKQQSTPVSLNWRTPVEGVYDFLSKPDVEMERDETETFLKQTGLKKPLTIPEWNEEALTRGLMEIQVDTNTSLLTKPHTFVLEPTDTRRINTWLVVEGKTVAMLDFLITPQTGNKPPEKEAVVSDIEVRSEEQGKGYAMKIIRTVENVLINQPLHSSGHYTPEGEKALRGKLPFTRQALFEEEQATKNPFHKGIGVRFSSMNFVKDWELFIKK